MQVIRKGVGPFPIVLVGSNEKFTEETLEELRKTEDLPGNFYVIGDNGIFAIKQTKFWEVTSKVEGIGSLGEVKDFCSLSSDWKKIPQKITAAVYKFFRDVEDKLSTESLALIYWNTNTEKYQVVIPTQKVSASSVNYVPPPNPEGCLRVMTIHSHPGYSSTRSSTDSRDEASVDKEGLHTIFAFPPKHKAPPSMTIALSTSDESYYFEQDDIFDLPIIQRVNKSRIRNGQPVTEEVIDPSFMDLVDKAKYPEDWMQAVTKEVWQQQSHSHQYGMYNGYNYNFTSFSLSGEDIPMEKVSNYNYSFLKVDPKKATVKDGERPPWKNAEEIKNSEVKLLSVCIEDPATSGLILPSQRNLERTIVDPKDTEPLMAQLNMILKDVPELQEIEHKGFWNWWKRLDIAIYNSSVGLNTLLLGGNFLLAEMDILKQHIPEMVEFVDPKGTKLMEYKTKLLQAKLVIDPHDVTNTFIPLLRKEYPEFWAIIEDMHPTIEPSIYKASDFTCPDPAVAIVVDDLLVVIQRLGKDNKYTVKNGKIELPSYSHSAGKKPSVQIPTSVAYKGLGAWRIQIRGRKDHSKTTISHSDGNESDNDTLHPLVSGVSTGKYVCTNCNKYTSLFPGSVCPLCATGTFMEKIEPKPSLVFAGTVGNTTTHRTLAGILEHGITPGGKLSKKYEKKIKRLIAEAAKGKKIRNSKDRDKCAVDIAEEILKEEAGEDIFSSIGIIETNNGVLYIEVLETPGKGEWNTVINCLTNVYPKSLLNMPVRITVDPNMLSPHMGTIIEIE